MQKMGKRKKQILNQMAVEILFLAAGAGIGALAMFAVALFVI